MATSKRTNQRTLGTVLKAKRQERGLSLRGLAEALEVAPSSVLRFESDERRPSPELLKRIAKLLHADPEELLALANHQLPTLAPYLRAKYDLDPEAIAELEAHFADVTNQKRPQRRSKP